MAPKEFENVSQDLVWQIVNGHGAQLCKRKQSGGVFFSRDPMNLTNKHSRKYEGFVNDKAVGIQPGPGGKGVSMKTKKASSVHKPVSAIVATHYGNQTGSRKIYRSVVNSTAKHDYRSDLRGEAVSRASAIKWSQKQKKDKPTPKLRGVKARKGAATSE